MDDVIGSGDVVRNKHYPHILYRALSQNSKSYGYIAPTGYLGYGDASNPAHWEKASLFTWWRLAIQWYFKNLLWCLQYKMNLDLGLVGREVSVSLQDKHYRNPKYFIYRAKLLFGILGKEYF
jgi:hypothetical protein